MKKLNLFSLLLYVALVSSCKDYFGDKTDISFIDLPKFQDREAAYVPIQPVLDGFVRPVHVMAGFDELIYVVDEATEEIISIDESGRELGRLRVKGVKKVAQDRRLDLLAIGNTDVFIPNDAGDVIENGVKGFLRNFACIYRIRQVNGIQYSLNSASFIDTIIHPFYFKNNLLPKDEDIEFTGIAVLSDNSFYVSRKGPSQSLTQNGGPDDAILLFDGEGVYTTPIAITAAGGFFRDYFRNVKDLATYARPPQVTVQNRRDFIYLNADENSPFRMRNIDYIESDFGVAYTPTPIPTTDTSEAESFGFVPYRFGSPSGITVTGDGTQFIFVVDDERDSLYQFTFNGLEGVPPPPSALNRKNLRVSFGGNGNGLSEFREPKAVAYLNRMVYVADAGNGRILRFRLTTDFN